MTVLLSLGDVRRLKGRLVDELKELATLIVSGQCISSLSTGLGLPSHFHLLDLALWHVHVRTSLKVVKLQFFPPGGPYDRSFDVPRSFTVTRIAQVRFI